jgi:hypothetical protein
MALHFSAERPDDQFYTDFGNLNKFEEEPFSKLSSILFSFLVSPEQSSQLLSELEGFATEHSLGLAALKNLVKSILIFFKAALRKNLSPSYVRDDLVQLGLSEERAESVSKQWKANLGSMSRVAAGQSLSVNQLVDMEWRFGVTAADSDMDKVGNSFLQIKMVLNKGSGTEEVFMELTLPQFYSFLHEMEKAKACLEYLS